MNDRRKIMLTHNTAEDDFKCPCCGATVHIGEQVGKNQDDEDCHALCVKEAK